MMARPLTSFLAAAALGLGALGQTAPVAGTFAGTMALSVLAASAPSPAAAQDSPAELALALSDALMMTDVFAVMQKEGEDYGRTLESELFPEAGGSRWQAAVATIYDPVRMRRDFDIALATALTGEAAVINEAIAFLRSERGLRILKLELEARRALLDPAVEEAATVRSEELRAKDDPLVARILRFERAGDLIEMNVAGALNANLAFYRGMIAEGGFPGGMTDEDMMAEVTGQEPEIRSETEGWLFPYMAMAYEPLTPEDFDAYIAFAESPAGQAMNAAIFTAFDTVFTRISHDLGAAAARQMKGNDI